jgi:hypothetical protein
MEPVTRRSFLVKGGVGAAGAAAAFGAGWKLSDTDSSDAALSSDEIDALNDGPLLVQVTDPAAGKGEVLVGERSVEFTDKALVARLLRAGR